MNFIKITLRNIRVFQEIEFDLKDRGLVGITGINGVGKTTIFNALRSLFYGGMNDGSKWDSLVRNNRDAQIYLEAEKNGKKYAFDLSRIKNKWVLTIMEDGVDITRHSQIDAKKQPAEILGLSKEEWDATVHLSQRGSHILVSGKPSERKAYISEFFGLDSKYDEVLSASEKELKEVQSKISAIEQFGPTKQALQEELNLVVIPDVEEDKEAYRKIEQDLILTQSHIDITKKELEAVNIYETYYNVAYPQGYESVDADQCYDFFLREQSELQNRRSNYDKAVKYNANVLTNNQKIDEMAAKIDKLSSISHRYPQGYSAVNTEIMELRSKERISATRAPIIQKMQSIKPNDLGIIDVKSLEEQQRALHGELAVLTQKYNAIHTGKCPTCGSEFQHSHLVDMYQELNSKTQMVTDITAQISEAHAHNKVVNDYRNYENQLANIPEMTSNESLHLEALVSDVNSLKEFEDLSRSYNSLQKMDLMEVIPPPTEAEIAMNMNNIAFYKAMKEARSRCPNYVPTTDRATLNNRLIELTQRISELTEAKNKISASLLIAEDSKARHARINQQIQEINKKFSELPELRESEIFWKEMVKAYGPKGIRVVQLEKVMNLVLTVLPVYTSRMFKDRAFEFEVVCDAGNIEILASRTDKNGTYKYDVSSLSGGESKKMALCLVLAVAKARLSHKKVNIVILDEVDSQIDSYGRYLFINEILPMIREEFESVFVISHSEEIKQASMYDEVLGFVQPVDSHYTEVQKVQL